MPELMVVVSIVMLLSGLLFPVFSQARARAKSSACTSNLTQIHKAILMYAGEYDDVFPAGKDCLDLYPPKGTPPAYIALMKSLPLLPEVVFPYSRSRDIFRCPADSGAQVNEAVFPAAVPLQPTAFGNCGNSYEWQTALGTAHVAMTMIQHPAEMNLAEDLAGHWHGSEAAATPTEKYGEFFAKTWFYRYNVVFIDGHARNLSWKAKEAAWRAN